MLTFDDLTLTCPKCEENLKMATERLSTNSRSGRCPICGKTWGIVMYPNDENLTFYDLDEGTMARNHRAVGYATILLAEDGELDDPIKEEDMPFIL
jgi:hypothetical protein